MTGRGIFNENETIELSSQFVKMILRESHFIISSGWNRQKGKLPADFLYWIVIIIAILKHF